MIATTIAALTQKRQNQTRRRATTSSSRSCWLSSPKRLGRGIIRWKTRSTRPRKTTTSASAARIDQYQAQPWVWFSQMTTTGAVRSATAVAARVRRRHWLASSVEISPCRSPVRSGASDAIRWSDADFPFELAAPRSDLVPEARYAGRLVASGP